MVEQALKSAGGIAKVGWVGEPTGQDSIGVIHLSRLNLSQELGGKGSFLRLLPSMGPFQRETQLFAHSGQRSGLRTCRLLNC